MKYLTLILLAGLSNLSAQTPPPPPPEGHRPPPSPVVGAIDINHDGMISAEEIALASESLRQLDRNQDGQLTRDEFCPPPPPRDQKPPQQSQQEESGQKTNSGY